MDLTAAGDVFAVHVGKEVQINQGQHGWPQRGRRAFPVVRTTVSMPLHKE
jgi:hypothetical protein